MKSIAEMVANMDTGANQVSDQTQQKRTTYGANESAQAGSPLDWRLSTLNEADLAEIMMEVETVMSSSFGHRWSSQSDGSVLEVWEQGLLDLTRRQVLVGLQAVSQGDGAAHGWDDVSWPPVLPVFRRMCGARPRDSHTGQYDRQRQEADQRALARVRYAALPAPERESIEARRKRKGREQLQAELEKIRAAQARHAAEHQAAINSLPPANDTELGAEQDNALWETYMAQFRYQQYLPGHGLISSWRDFLAARKGGVGNVG